MINVIKKSYRVSIYSSVLLLLIGLLLFWNPGLVVSIISYVIGFFLLVVGVSQIINYYQNRSMSAMTVYLFIGIIVSVIGLVLIIKPNLIATLIPFVVGLFIIMNSIEGITISVTLKGKDDKWYISFIFQLITLVLGIFLIVNPLMGSFIVTEILGIIIIIYSILDLIEKFTIKKKFEQIDKVKDKNIKIIDAE